MTQRLTRQSNDEDRKRFSRLAIPDLTAHLATLLPQIPAGFVTTYGDIAQALGDLAAARWVAEVLKTAPDWSLPVLHRVMRRDGTFPGGHSQEQLLQQELLLNDETTLPDGSKADGIKFWLSQRRWTSFAGVAPLAQLSHWQTTAGSQVLEERLEGQPRFMGGVDLSYLDDHRAVGVFALVDATTGELLAYQAVTAAVPFPYIPGYLTFRELPVLLELIEQAAELVQRAEVILVDGNGILHPRRAGIATALGQLTGLRTIGVSKHLLCGRLQPADSQGVRFLHDAQDEVLGAALRPPGRKPLYVSIGSRTDLSGAVAAVQSVWMTHRLPEPIYHADRLSRQLARAGSG